MLLVACRRRTNVPITFWCAHIGNSNEIWWSSHCRLSGPQVCLYLPSPLSLPLCGYACMYGSTQTSAYIHVCLLEWLAQLLAFDLCLNWHELISCVPLASLRKRPADSCYSLPVLQTAQWDEAAFWAGPKRQHASAEIPAVPNLGHI